MGTHRGKLEALVGADTYKRFRLYFRIARQNFRGPSKTLEVVAARPV